MRNKRPKNKETRIIKRFLLFPRTIDYETRWLETAEIEQVFNENGGIHGVSKRWEDSHWKNK